MSLSTVIGGILILALVFLIVRGRKSAPRTQRPAVRPAKSAAPTEFHAVSIKFVSGACAAAKSLEGKRFLSSAAPKIPLPECDVLECKCRFIHHSDRREGEDRRNPYRGRIGIETGQHQREQRHGKDRRKGPDPS